MKILPRRRLIPKWRPVAATLNTVEATSTANKKTSVTAENADELNLAISQWRESKNPGLLGEILSFSVDRNLRDLVITVGYEALNVGAVVTPVQNLLIRDLGKNHGPAEPYTAVPLGPVEENYPFQKPIQRLRSLLRFAPDNALALLDYAQLQTALGKTKSAERSLRTALSLSPNNRTILRTLARFYVHTQRPDVAHQLIRRHARTPQDPWLMASEIALADAADSESFFLGKAKRFLIDHAKFPEGHLTELSGNIALAELHSGNMKKARESQRRALLAPNDNVVAQAVDFQHYFGIELLTSSITRAINSSAEALLLQAWEAVDLTAIEKHAIAWHSEEPFSSRPIQLLSSLYAYKGAHATALRWIEAGLRTDSQDRGLLINLAFVYADMGSEGPSHTTLKRMRHAYGKDIEPFANATEGLLAYHLGKFADGDNLYNQAVDEFNRQGNPRLGAFCRLNQAFLAVKRNHPAGMDLAKNAIAQVRAHPSLDSRMLLKIQFADVEGEIPKESAELRKLSQWTFDIKANTLIETPGVTSKTSKPLIILGRDAK